MAHEEPNSPGLEGVTTTISNRCSVCNPSGKKFRGGLHITLRRGCHRIPSAEVSPAQTRLHHPCNST